MTTLQATSPAAFLEDHLFDRIPHVFLDDRPQYVNWRRTLGAKIEVDPSCIMLVGTAAIGRSLNPAKNFKPFDERSDVDVAIISPYHFTSAWRYLRANNSRRLSVDPRTRIAWDDHVTKFIYWGTIATDRLLGVLPFGHVWLDACVHMASVAPTENRDINLRIYNDFESLRSYQVQSVKRVRENLSENKSNA